MKALTKTVPAKGAYAFWGYDLFPYLLGGQIGEHPATNKWHNDDAVFIPSYGSFFGYRFCLDAESGKQLLDEINRLKGEERSIDREAEKLKTSMRRQSIIHSVDPRKD